MHAVLADRAEQCLGESAVPAAAYHQEVGAVGGIEQYLRGIALDDAVRTGTPLPKPAFSKITAATAMLSRGVPLTQASTAAAASRTASG
jgi:hypothetical protein